MALGLGTNCGFVTVAPSADPTGGEQTAVDNNSMAQKDTVPADATTITEIGWYCNNATNEANFEVGMYSHHAGNDEPENVIGALDQTNAKGTGAGWKKVTGLNIDISSYQSAITWIAFQLDNTSSNTYVDRENTSGRYSKNTGETTLTDPWGASSETAKIVAIYALYTTGGGSVAIAGSSDAVSTLLAPLKALRKVTASSAGVSVVVDSALLATRKIAGSSDGVSTLGGALGRSLALSGSSDAISTLIGTLLAVGEVALSGSLGAVSSLIGGARLSLGLSGDVTALSTLSGVLHIPTVPQNTYIVYINDSLYFYIDGVVVMKLDNV